MAKADSRPNGLSQPSRTSFRLGAALALHPTHTSPAAPHALATCVRSLCYPHTLSKTRPEPILLRAILTFPAQLSHIGIQAWKLSDYEDFVVFDVRVPGTLCFCWLGLLLPAVR